MINKRHCLSACKSQYYKIRVTNSSFIVIIANFSEKREKDIERGMITPINPSSFVQKR